MSKPLIVAKTKEISYEQWLKERRKGVGGSDAAAVVGLSRYSSPLDVWLQKTNRKPATPDNEAMLWGRLLEPVVRQEFARRTGLTVKECPYLMAHKNYPFMLANVDGIIVEKDGSKCVLEIKTTSSFTAIKDIEDGLPVEWYCQVQHYLAVTELSKAYRDMPRRLPHIVSAGYYLDFSLSWFLIHARPNTQCRVSKRLTSRLTTCLTSKRPQKWRHA